MKTRERIVAATQALHQEVGPARTTIADIARRAGVERLTVYNHFPELIQLLGACQSHFLANNPPPEISPGAVAKKDALARLESALTAHYGWFRAHELLQEKVFRDRHLLPELDELLRTNADPRFELASAEYAHLIAARPKLAVSVRKVVRLALDFGTWKLLTADGAADSDAAKLMTQAVAAAAVRT